MSELVEPKPAPRRAWLSRAWLKGAVKLLLFLIVVVGIAHRVRSQIAELSADQVGGVDWNALQYGWLAASGGFYLLGFLPCAWFWRRLLERLGQPADWLSLLRAYYIGHLGKYVPGKALVVVLRAGFLPHCDKAVASVTVFYETLTMMAVGSLTAAIILAVQGNFGWTFLLALGLSAATGAPVTPWVFGLIYRRMGVGRLAPAMADRVRHLGFGNLLAGAGPIAVGWWATGLSLTAVVHGLGLENGGGWNDWPLMTACVALSLVAGFVSLIPGGAGVREWVLMELLAPRLGVVPALQASIVLRLVWLLAELAISIILYMIPTRGPGAATAKTPSLETPSSEAPRIPSNPA